jgi:hypothetical protein
MNGCKQVEINEGAVALNIRVAKTHRGELTQESKDEMLQSGCFYKARLQCICGATVTGVLDLNKQPRPLEHTIAKMPSNAARRRILRNPETA